MLELRAALLDSDARLESTRDALRDLADQLHAGGYKDRRGHLVHQLAALKNADRLLDRAGAAEAQPANPPRPEPAR